MTRDEYVFNTQNERKISMFTLLSHYNKENAALDLGQVVRGMERQQPVQRPPMQHYDTE